MPSRNRTEKSDQLEPRTTDGFGEAAAAEKNRERDTRLCVIEAFGRLGVHHNEWPDFVRAFYSDPQQRIEYHACMTPSPFQPPEFDQLNQSPKEWLKLANEAFAQHCQEFLQDCQKWVRAGVDEPIAEKKRARGGGKRRRADTGGRRRKDNTAMNRRYEWAARYLLKHPLKEIAGEDADPSRVGRVAREIVKLAGWG